MRVPCNVARYARRLETLGSDDWKVEFRPGPDTRKAHPELPAVLTCRLIYYQWPGYRSAWLLTSLLDAQTFPVPELVSLYHRRWCIETVYREWKHVLDIQNLRSQTPCAICKEMHAHLLLNNLVRWVMTDAAQGTGKTPLEFSFVSAVTAVRTALLVMLRLGAPLAALYRQLLDDIRQAEIRQRPGRSYPRPGESKVKKREHGKLRFPARLQTLT
jgi:hypothetical protein